MEKLLFSVMNQSEASSRYAPSPVGAGWGGSVKNRAATAAKQTANSPFPTVNHPQYTYTIVATLYVNK